MFFGVVAVTGTAYLQAGHWGVLPFTLSIPVGLLVTNILVVNNLRDLPTDIVAGKRTLATRIGDRASRIQYALFAIAAYVIPSALGAIDPARRWMLLPLLTIPLGASLIRQILGGVSGRELNPLLKRTGQLLLAFGALLAIGAALSGAG